MRLLAVAALAVALVAPALPLANAAHMGPCWHEYVEGALLALKEGPSALTGTIRYCLGQSVWLCEIMDPCPLP